MKYSVVECDNQCGLQFFQRRWMRVLSAMQFNFIEEDKACEKLLDRSALHSQSLWRSIYVLWLDLSTKLWDLFPMGG
jgi:hypothetical protein